MDNFGLVIQTIGVFMRKYKKINDQSMSVNNRYLHYDMVQCVLQTFLGKIRTYIFQMIVNI